jgi:hypothetical protein
MGQVVETDDGLPFIGENANQEFIATGFCGQAYALYPGCAGAAAPTVLYEQSPGLGQPRRATHVCTAVSPEPENPRDGSSPSRYLRPWTALPCPGHHRLWQEVPERPRPRQRTRLS